MNRRDFLVTALGALATTACVGTDDPPPGGTESTTVTVNPTVSAEPAGSTPIGQGPETTTTPPDALDAPDVSEFRTSPFALGVASGDPVPTGVILWTRLVESALADAASDDLDDVPLVWEIASDPRFERLTATGRVVAQRSQGHSVHVDAGGLAPGTTYHYRFRVGAFTSDVGRTRTAPGPGDPAALRMASLSCQNWQHGYFHAQGAIANDEVDLVVFCGDYIYESTSSGAVRTHDTPEPLDLDGYRARYRQYRSDPQLQRAHAVAPWIVTWDDHEVQNNYAGVVPAVADSGFDARRLAAYQAWWEHMPVRLPPPIGPSGNAAGATYPIHREIVWGDLARFVVLDGRQYRDDQPCDDGYGTRCDEALDPQRSMLGAEQEAWLDAVLATPHPGWTIVVQQTVFTDLNVRLTGTPITNFDQWDGYAAARWRLLDAVERHGVNDIIVLSGDIHSSIVAGITDADRRPDPSERAILGTEFVAPSSTSRFAANQETLFTLGVLSIPHVEWVDAERHGHLELTVDTGQVLADYHLFDTVDLPDQANRSIASRWRVQTGVAGPQAV